MRANLDAQGGHVLAEPVMLALAARVGKHRAHELVHRVAALERRAGRSLADAASADPEIAAHLSPAALAELLRPELSLGAAGAAIDDVRARARARTGTARP
jgi:adenylosuccinate lyase